MGLLQKLQDLATALTDINTLVPQVMTQLQALDDFLTGA